MAKPAPIEGPTVTFYDWRIAFNALLAAAPEVVESASSSPTTADEDYEVGTLWIRKDTNISWILVHSTLGEGGASSTDALWVQLGATPGALINDGSVELVGPWDAGAFSITAARFISEVAQGTAPFSAISTTLCPNLNADLLDGLEGASYVRTAGLNPLSGNWDVGAFDITNVGGFSSEMIIANIVATTRLNLGDIVAQFGTSGAGSSYSLGRPIATGTFILSGGASSGGGFNSVYYGSSHATQANDGEFRAGASVKLAWDHSATNWDFQNTNIVNVGLLEGRDIAIDGAKLDTVADDANNYTHPSHIGDVTGSGELTIGNEKVTNAKLANMAAGTIKLNTGALGDPEDSTILALTEEASPGTGDFLLGQEAGGLLRKFAADQWVKTAPVLLRNPYKKHNTSGGASGITVTIDCEQHPSEYVTITGAGVTIDLDFPTYSGNNRGTTHFALSGKVWVRNQSGDTITVTSNAGFSPFGGSGNGAKGVEPLGAGDYGCLVWEFFDDNTTRFVWAEWINE